MTSFQDAPDEAMEMTKQWRLVLASIFNFDEKNTDFISIFLLVKQQANKYKQCIPVEASGCVGKLYSIPSFCSFPVPWHQLLFNRSSSYFFPLFYTFPSINLLRNDVICNEERNNISNRRHVRYDGKTAAATRRHRRRRKR